MGDEIGPLGCTSQSCRASSRPEISRSQTHAAGFCTTVPCRTLQHAAAGCSSLRYPAHTSLTKHSSGAVYPQACSKARKSGVSPGLVENGLPLDGPRAALWWAEMAAGQVVLRRLSPPAGISTPPGRCLVQRSDLTKQDIAKPAPVRLHGAIICDQTLRYWRCYTWPFVH